MIRATFLLAIFIWIICAVLWLWPIRTEMPAAPSHHASVEDDDPVASFDAEAVRFESAVLFDPIEAPRPEDLNLPEETRVLALPEPTLLGLANDESGAIAWLALPGEERRLMREGGVIGAWQVTHISDTSVRLHAGDQVVTLGLFENE